jgi:rod shape-determining protein MreC
VGKVKEVAPLSSLVLAINDRESGAGILLQNSRLHGILRGTGLGELQVSDVMSDEKVEVGEPVVTSGGDGVYPKGFPVGAVTKIAGDVDGGPFLAIRIKPSANLDRLEEVLVVTKIAEESLPAPGEPTPRRAAEVLAERLPSITKPADNANKTPSTSGVTSAAPTITTETGAKPKSIQNAPGNTKTGSNEGMPDHVAPARKPKATAKPSPSPAPSDLPPTDNTQDPPEKKKSQQPPAADPEKPPR